MSRNLRSLVSFLDYEFEDPALLEEALTHRSAKGRNNERLEFLGDSILGCVVSAWLYSESPQATEGDLSRLRASLVKKDTLADLAAQIRLGDYLSLGSGELKSGGFRRESILADALEALIGGLYLDGGMARADAFIKRLFAERVRDALAAGVEKDPKTLLQEYLQKRGAPLPEYEVTAVEGKAHERIFTVHCHAGEPALLTMGEGRSRRAAEQTAAVAMMEQISGD